jgi:23S rRNA (uracil1939-C5)-methyltransferase
VLTCLHFGLCGGCTHTSDDTDKRALVVNALERAGFAAPAVAPLVVVPLRSRRRADLGVQRQGAALALGLHRAGGGPVVDMTECALLAPRLFAALAPLRVLLRSLEGLRQEGAVVISALDTGLDILVRLDAPATQGDRQRMIAFARAQALARISACVGAELPEPVAILARPEIAFAGTPVEVPPGAFLQASPAGEAAIVAAMLAALPSLTRKSRIVELFAGVGTLSLPLAGAARVEAYEADAPAAMALERAVRAHSLAGRLSITVRDLFRRPVQGAALAAAAVVLDPPFGGAGAQMRFIAASGVKRVIYVSCNPATLAHDAAQLRHAGYELTGATPIDQFRYADHIEAVVAFSRR